MKKLIWFILIINYAHAFVISKSETGADVKWRRSNKDLNLFVNPYPIRYDLELDIDEESWTVSTETYQLNRIINIVDTAASEWNAHSPYQIQPTYLANSVFSFTDSINSFAFSNNVNLFGSGVLAVTTLSYEADTGKINAADVLINQSINNFVSLSLDESASSDDTAYLGDVVTHEFGHFLGLAHSEVIGSTMIFSIFQNQHTIHEDDMNGIYTNYNLEVEQGSIGGKVVSDTGSAIFGAQVKLISVLDNSVFQGVLTNEEGEFFFENVPVDGSYTLMVTPTKNLDALPEFYKNARSDYCAQKDFVPSFFQTCGGRGKGSPQILSLAEDDFIDVGTLTIRCDENLDAEYLGNKVSDSSDFTDIKDDYAAEYISFAGVFFDDEIQETTAGNGDRILLDFSDIAVNTGDVVRINFMSTGLGSAFKFYVSAKRIDSSLTSDFTSSSDETLKTITDLSIDLALSQDQDDNQFEITIYPIALSDEEGYDIFGSPSVLSNANNIYMMFASVGSYQSGVFVPNSTPDSFPYEDNLACLEGTLGFEADAYIPLSSARINAADGNDDSVFACGTIEFDDSDSSQGPMSFLFGFILLVLIGRMRDYFLSNS